MSLKTFHIFFIVVSTLFLFGYGAWNVTMYQSGGSLSPVAYAGASFLAGAGLVVYGIRFLRKLKNVSYL